jgi:hypothetical protein
LSTIFNSQGDEIENPFHDAKLIGTDYDNEAYHKQEGKRGSLEFIMRRSTLMDFYANPHKWIDGYERPATDAMDFGSILDCLAMQPDKFRGRYHVRPATYYNEKQGKDKKWTNAATYCKEWTEAHSDKLICPAEDFESANAAIKAMQNDPLVWDLFEHSLKQVCVHAVYKDEATKLEVPVKIMIDLQPSRKHPFFGNKLADYKTCQNAGHRKWKRHVFDYFYHVQAAFYADVWSALHPEEKLVEFIHVLQESYAPFAIGRRMLSGAFMNIGRNTYQSALAFYCQCLKDQRWPGLDDNGTQRSIQGWTIVEPEAWMITSGLNDL